MKKSCFRQTALGKRFTYTNLSGNNTSVFLRVYCYQTLLSPVYECTMGPCNNFSRWVLGLLFQFHRWVNWKGGKFQSHGAAKGGMNLEGWCWSLYVPPPPTAPPCLPHHTHGTIWWAKGVWSVVKERWETILGNAMCQLLSYLLTHLTLAMTLWEGYNYYPHFTDEKTETETLAVCPEAT